jgi:hypothetical protein
MSPSHSAMVVKPFLARQPPDRTRTDIFFSFLRWKLPLKGKRFRDIEDIKEGRVP